MWCTALSPPPPLQAVLSHGQPHEDSPGPHHRAHEAREVLHEVRHHQCIVTLILLIWSCLLWLFFNSVEFKGSVSRDFLSLFFMFQTHLGPWQTGKSIRFFYFAEIFKFFLKLWGVHQLQSQTAHRGVKIKIIACLWSPKGKIRRNHFRGEHWTHLSRKKRFEVLIF